MKASTSIITAFTLMIAFLHAARLGAFRPRQLLVRLLGAGMLCFSVAATEAYDIYDYAEEVCREIGPFPSFNAFDLGQEIPVTLNGTPITGPTTGPHPFDTSIPFTLCDRPNLLGTGGNQALPYSRIGRLPGLDPITRLPSTDISWIFITRRYYNASSPTDPLFSDVALIGYNKRSGATAFFQAGLNGLVKDVRKVPSPMGFQPLPGEPAASNFWLTPQDTANIYCYQCHTNGPFIHDPYVDQVKVNGQMIIPIAAMPVNGVPEPYWFVGSQEFSKWAQPKYLIKPGNLCTSCHAIGEQPKSNFLVMQFSGRSAPSQINPAFNGYPLNHYMPNDQNGLTYGDASQEAWEQHYGASVNEVLNCRNNINDSSCWQPRRRISDPGPLGSIFLNPSSLSNIEDGSCANPYKTLENAYAAVPLNGYLIAAPGTYIRADWNKAMTVVKWGANTPGQVTIVNH
jgi:hypothetical protein